MLVLADVHRAADAGPLELDVVAVPRVVEVEALVQVLGDLLRDVLRLLVRELVALAIEIEAIAIPFLLPCPGVLGWRGKG